MLGRDRATIHLVFEARNGWTAVVPGQTEARGTAGDDLVGQKWVEIVHGIDLASIGICPRETQKLEPPLHFAQHIARLFTHGIGAGLAVAHGAFAVERAALARFTTAGDHKAGRGRRGALGKGEGVKGRLRRCSNFRTDVAARHRIGAVLAVVDPPFFQGADVEFIEGAKAGVRKGGWRAQFAGTKRAEWSPACADDLGDALKAARQGKRMAKAHALDAEPRFGRHAARILKYRWNEAIAAGCEDRGRPWGHALASFS